jgi:hypothetical protein
MFDRIYLVMWEELDRGECLGGNLYVSLDPQRAEEFMINHCYDTNLVWDEKHDMWVEHWKYGWKKVYIETIPLDEEL